MIIAWEALFVGFCVLDTMLTKVALRIGCVELNPIAVQNPWGKMVIALGIVVLLHIFKKQDLIIPLCLGIAAICCWNVVMIAITVR